jgi:hypothetical protein
MAVSTSQGDEKKHQAALLKMKFYLFMADGTFIELAVSPLPPPACHVRGVHFAKEGNLDLIYIHITDTDDLDKVSIWVVTDKKVTNLNLMPYVADRYNYEANAISASGLGAVSGDQWVNVYDRNNKLIGQAIPCAVS